MHRSLLLTALWLAAHSPLLADPAASVLFASTGKAPNHTYRIPTLCLTSAGTLLAFAELRHDSAGDSGNIDTVVRRSTDGGKTWSPEQVMLDLDNHTIGNACPIVDPVTRIITVVATWNKVPEGKTAPGWGEDSRRVYVTRSSDDGITWSKPEDVSSQVKQPTWSWFASGPGAGLVMRGGPHPGRYVLGVNHRETAGPAAGYYAHVIYSDDRGRTWKSSSAFAARHTNECEAVELENGSLMLNMRNHGSPKHERAVSISNDGGETWGETKWDATLPESQCMASLHRLTWSSPQRPGVILFSNPASRSKRENLTLRASNDQGTTWPLSLTIDAGSAAYSHICTLPDGGIGLAWEEGATRNIVFRKLRLSELHPDPPSVRKDG